MHPQAPTGAGRPTPRSVTIVQRRLTHYRLPLFERMRSSLQAEGVRLRLLHGVPTASERSKNDEGQLAWAEALATHYWLDDRVCWQPFLRQAAGSDLLIVTQENKLVNNLTALAQPWRAGRLAFWGHGRNLQSERPDGVLERFKRWTTTKVNWWFAYTELSARLVREDGFPASRITVLNNSIDTTDLRSAVALARLAPREALRVGLGLPTAGPLGVFVGSLYEGKRIPWLLRAAEAIHACLPDFHLAIAGAGPDKACIDEAAARLPYVHALGGVRGERKAQLLAAADVMLNPGLVGLGILDAFVAGLPMLTTDRGLHSPEIAYLQSGDNGLITADDLGAFVNAVVQLLQDPAQAQRLRAGALQAGELYSIEGMSDRFCTGILACLRQTPSA